MLETELGNRLYSYAFYSAAVVAMMIAMFFHSLCFLAASTLLLAASATYFHSGHIINNFLLRRGSVIEVYNNHKLSESLTSAVKRVGDSYFSVSCALLKKVTDERNGELIASIISNIDFPFEFCLGLKRVDKNKILDDLEEKRRLKEIEITRSDAKKYDRISNLKRELSVIEGEIRTIRGQNPLAFSLRLKCFASARNENDAIRESSRNATQLASAFSSALGFEYEILKGELRIEEPSLERGVE